MVNISLDDPCYVQVGFVSFGKECPNINRGGVYTRVSGFKPWIQRHAEDAQFEKVEACDTNTCSENIRFCYDYIFFFEITKVKVSEKWKRNPREITMRF